MLSYVKHFFLQGRWEPTRTCFKRGDPNRWSSKAMLIVDHAPCDTVKALETSSFYGHK